MPLLRQSSRTALRSPRGFFSAGFAVFAFNVIGSALFKQQ
jgi:hypothetical protein